MRRRFRPALRGSWGLAFGLALGPAIALAGRDPSGRIWPWVLMTAVFLSLLIHRLSLVYELTEDALIVFSWWGLGQPERITLSGIEKTEVLNSLVMRVAGCGHVHVASSLPGEKGLTLLAQPRAEALADELEELGRAARSEPPQPDASELETGGSEKSPGETALS